MRYGECSKMNNVDLDDLALENLKFYLRIPSVSPNPDLGPCVEFLKKQAASLELPVKVIEFTSGKPIVVISWEGLQPRLPSILLNGHMDVVPVNEKEWIYPPFEAQMDEDGNIYARGAQDMKSVSIQYLEAIRRLQLQGARLQRTVHVSFMPDEETGGTLGMKLFVKSEEFKKLNVGFALDEGAVVEYSSDFMLGNGQKCPWTIHFYCPGQSGHASLLLKDTPGVKATYMLNKLNELREDQEKLLEESPSLTPGDVISLNVTIMSGGVQSNVIPDQFDFTVDSRLPLTLDLKKFEDTLTTWCKEAGEGVWIDYERKDAQIPATKLDESNKYWVAFKKASDELNMVLKPQILSGGTDSRYLRELSIPAIAFSPINNTEGRLHEKNEYLNQDIFLKGISIYMKLLTSVANVEE